MNRFITCVLVFACSLLTMGLPEAHSQVMAAKPLRFDFTVTKKRLDVERVDKGSTNITEEKWAYEVAIRNSTFVDQGGLTIEYRNYRQQDSGKHTGARSKLPLIAHPGTEKIEALTKSGIYKFTTKAVEIKKSELKANWFYSDGTKDKVKDTLFGIWLRVLKDGEIVSEYFHPASLKSKTEW